MRFGAHRAVQIDAVAANGAVDADNDSEMGELGVELVRGDLNDPASYCPAFKEADGVFLTSNC